MSEIIGIGPDGQTNPTGVDVQKAIEFLINWTLLDPRGMRIVNLSKEEVGAAFKVLGIAKNAPHLNENRAGLRNENTIYYLATLKPDIFVEVTIKPKQGKKIKEYSVIKMGEEYQSRIGLKNNLQGVSS